MNDEEKRWVIEVLIAYVKELKNRSNHILIKLELYGINDAIKEFKKVRIEYDRINEFLQEHGVLVNSQE